MVQLLNPSSSAKTLRHMTTEQFIYAGFTLLLMGLSAINARRLILPNVSTIPGMLTGLVLSWLFPSLHGESTGSASLIASGVGAIVGAGAMYLLRWAGKVLFGKLRFDLPANTTVEFWMLDELNPGITAKRVVSFKVGPEVIGKPLKFYLRPGLETPNGKVLLTQRGESSRKAEIITDAAGVRKAFSYLW